ncbi:MAG: PLP-dependent aminotransferase family protein [Kiloniellales bacterium]
MGGPLADAGRKVLRNPEAADDAAAASHVGPAGWSGSSGGPQGVEMVKRTGGALLLSMGLDRESARPISTQLCMALREVILSGGLSAGDRLPASRTLAKDLGISRTTVNEAFERLVAEGLIESRVGAGTFVSQALKAERPMPPAGTRQGQQAFRRPHLATAMTRAIGGFAERQRLPHQPRAFVTALPALDAFPLAQWSRLMAKHWRGGRDEVMGYGDPNGYRPLRCAIAGHLRANRGITCEPEQIFITGGAQEAFHLIGSLLLNPGDKVWFENPGAIGARNSFVACGADLVPVPIDGEGLRVDVGLEKAPRFRLAFVTPSHHQPLGAILSLERRFALLQAAERAASWIVEDDYDGEFCYGRQPLPTLKSVDTTGRVIYVGTFSKSLFPSLRLGYLLAPPALIPTFEHLMSAFLPGVPTSLQAVTAAFIEEGYFVAHIRRMRKIYAERHQALRDAAVQRLAGLLDVIPTDSGLHTVGYLPRGLSESAVAEAAERRGITVSPIRRFSLKPTGISGLVLGFGSIRAHEIRTGVEVLGQALEGMMRQKRRA